MEVLGLDIGATGIKGAVVETSTGELLAERFRLETPQPATPAAMVETATRVIRHFDWKGPVGVGFPAIVKNGVAHSASNIDKSWIGANVQGLLAESCDCPVLVANDADVAALAENKFGAGRGIDGLIIMLTLGTGIGSTLLNRGKFWPNTELGHVVLPRGITIEAFAAESVKKREGLKSKEWGVRLDECLRYLDFLFSPDLFILGGGGAKKFDKFAKSFTLGTMVVPAEQGNLAGIIGAALLVEQ